MDTMTTIEIWVLLAMNAASLVMLLYIFQMMWGIETDYLIKKKYDRKLRRKARAKAKRKGKRDV